MLRVELARAVPGMKLALPVRHPRVYEQVLLRRGYALERDSITRMLEMGIRDVWVRYPSLDFLGKFVNEHVLASQSRLVHDITRAFEAVQSQASAKLSYKQYTRTIGSMIDNLVENPQAAVFLGDISNSIDGRDLMRHSSSVAYLSLLMGLKLEGYLVKQRKHIDPARAKEVINLGLGGILHDMGVMQLPAEVRAKYHETGDDADPAWREHTRLGFEMIHGKVPPSAATIVLHHHQRFDGSGWAGKDAPVLDGHRLHVFARIVSLADYFDEQRYPVNGKERPTVQALGRLLEPDVMKMFDPQALRALFTVAPPYPPGSVVRLSDGQWAAVIDHLPADPCRPIVQPIPDPNTNPPSPEGTDAADAPTGSEGKNIDLSEASPSLQVAQAGGREVLHLNFKSPAMLSDPLNSTWF